MLGAVESTALTRAAGNGHIKVVRYLAENLHVNVNNRGLLRGLIHAVNANHKDIHGFTALMSAAGGGT